MEWTIEYSDPERCLFVATTGKLLIDDQKEMFRQISLFPEWNRTVPILFDNRLLELSGSNYDLIRQSALLNEEFIKANSIERLAGVVNDGINFGVGRQFATLFEVVGGNGFRLFKEMDLALRWLRKEID